MRLPLEYRRRILASTWALLFVMGMVAGWLAHAASAAAAEPVKPDGGYSFSATSGIYRSGTKMVAVRNADEEWGYISGSGEMWVNPRLPLLGQECVRYQLKAWLPECKPWRPWTEAP